MSCAHGNGRACDDCFRERAIVAPHDQQAAHDDAHYALVCLQLECAALRQRQASWTRESLERFIECSKQRLNVLATAAPFIPEEPK